MVTRSELIRRILLALDALDGTPTSHELLVDAARLRFSPRPPVGDVEDAITEAEKDHYITGADVPHEGVHYVLTLKGQLKARSWK